MSCIASSSRTMLQQILRPLARPALLTNCPPFARPTSSSSSAEAASTKPKAAKKQGTILTGLNVLKDQPEVKAKADEEYPSWLWTILDESKDKVGEAGPDPRVPRTLKGAEEFAGYKKQLRSANRSNIKASNYLKTT